MQIVSTIGPDNVTNCGLPFVAAKGAAADGDDVDLFFAQEGAYMGSDRHSDWTQLQSPGLPTVAELFEAVTERDALREFVVCEPCTNPRGIEEADLRAFARIGGPEDLTAQARRNDTTMTF